MSYSELSDRLTFNFLLGDLGTLAFLAHLFWPTSSFDTHFAAEESAKCAKKPRTPRSGSVSRQFEKHQVAARL